jgi:hypothetical protein
MSSRSACRRAKRGRVDESRRAGTYLWPARFQRRLRRVAEACLRAVANSESLHPVLQRSS